jgi:hypothetical protein
MALLWNQWDEADPLQREIDELLEPLRPRAAAQQDEPDGRRALDASPLFGPIDERVFRHRRALTADQLVEWVSSTSAVVTAPPAEQARIEARVRSLTGDGEVDLTLETLVLVLDRV